MRDMVLEVVNRLRSAWPNLLVKVGAFNKGDKDDVGIRVAVQRWVQRLEGSEVHLSITYRPAPDTSQMDQIMAWLSDLRNLVQHEDPENLLAQWWLGDVQFDAAPLSVTCGLVLRLGLEDVQ